MSDKDRASNYRHERHQTADDALPRPLAESVNEFAGDEQKALQKVWENASVLRRREPSEERLAELGSAIWTSLEPHLNAPRGTARIHRLHPFTQWRSVAAAILVLAVSGVLFARWPETITAPHGQRLSVQLPDGSEVDLNSGAMLTYSPRIFGWISRSTRLEGEAFFRVERRESPFLVRTFNAKIRVLGTSFNVRAWPDEFSPETSVTLYEGRVRLANAKDSELAVELVAGQVSSVSRYTGRPSLPRNTDLQQATAWRMGRFVFVDQPLGSILKEMERRFDTKIRIESSQIVQDRLTLSYEEPVIPEIILQDIASSYSRYGFRRIAGGYELFVAPSP